jgi:fumarate hydratase class I
MFLRHTRSAIRPQTRLFSSNAGTNPFQYKKLFDPCEDEVTVYRKLTSDHVEVKKLENIEFLHVHPQALRLLTSTAMRDIAHLLRSAHLKQLSNILKDPEATENVAQNEAC